jgi:hypothetical protein
LYLKNFFVINFSLLVEKGESMLMTRINSWFLGFPFTASVDFYFISTTIVAALVDLLAAPVVFFGWWGVGCNCILNYFSLLSWVWMAGVVFSYFKTVDLSDAPHLPPAGLLRSKFVGCLI